MDSGGLGRSRWGGKWRGFHHSAHRQAHPADTRLAAHLSRIDHDSPKSCGCHRGTPDFRSNSNQSWFRFPESPHHLRMARETLRLPPLISNKDSTCTALQSYPQASFDTARQSCADCQHLLIGNFETTFWPQKGTPADEPNRHFTAVTSPQPSAKICFCLEGLFDFRIHVVSKFCIRRKVLKQRESRTGGRPGGNRISKMDFRKK